MNKDQHTTTIKQLATSLGFDYCGIAEAGFLQEDARRLEQWLLKGFQGSMAYMERHFDLRTDPTKLVPGARSVITLMMNYYPKEQQAQDAPKIARYAWGQDYHEVIRDKMNLFLTGIRATIGAVEGRGFVDSAPVLERAWAAKSGLGWVGKNGNLINKQSGSYFFLATLIVDLELNYDDPYAKDYCGNCTRCVDACPTDAIVGNALIDGSKCISYLTIELKDELMAPEFKDKMQGWMFGCDICQEVCPWNRFSQPHQQSAFQALPVILDLSTAEWKTMEEDSFRTLLKHSPLKRTKWKGIQRNLNMITAE